jgi:hypothetical protein
VFSVIFEVHPKPEQWDAYLGYAKMLRPELEQVEGFVDNIRYGSLSSEGWILSLSSLSGVFCPTTKMLLKGQANGTAPIC